MEFNRRTFLASAGALAGLGLVGCSTVPSRRTVFAPNEKLRHACIGVGGMGFNDLKNFIAHARVEIVAICDVDANNLAKAGELVPKARRYRDWRELLEKETDIDAVNIAVPDHSHAIIALAAMRKGKNVYCQKPLCHDVGECRDVALEAERCQVVTQLGTQFAAGGGDRMAVGFLRAGMIGAVKKVYLTSNRTGAEFYRLKGPRPEQGEAAPANLAWDLWLGTAPERPFAKGIYHQMKWRSWLDFGTGWSGDIGCHIFDAVWKGMNLGSVAPKTIHAQVQESWKKDPARRADVWPQSNHVTWEFDGVPASDGKPFTMEWFDGEFYPPEDGQSLAREAGFDKFPEEAALVIGTEGAILIPHQKVPHLLPKAKFAQVPRPKMPPKNHYHDFADGCLGVSENASPFQKTGPMAETIILGTVAIRCPEETLRWDAAHLAFKDNPAATKLLRRTYRTGW
ncbi:MAG: Gfo/Idh/MocA family oxidoreductase [bacterium]|nr:Gfo/Idh/MocA family oxidoreductase [bacterium]